MNRGTSDGYDEHKVRRLVVESAKSERPEEILSIQLRRSHSFVEAKVGVADAAVEASSSGLEREDKPVIIERARTRG